jgi:hypothetical protein
MLIQRLGRLNAEPFNSLSSAISRVLPTLGPNLIVLIHKRNPLRLCYSGTVCFSLILHLTAQAARLRFVYNAATINPL